MPMFVLRQGIGSRRSGCQESTEALIASLKCSLVGIGHDAVKPKWGHSAHLPINPRWLVMSASRPFLSPPVLDFDIWTLTLSLIPSRTSCVTWLGEVGRKWLGRLVTWFHHDRGNVSIKRVAFIPPQPPPPPAFLLKLYAPCHARGAQTSAVRKPFARPLECH